MKEYEHLRVQLDVIKHATNNFGATNFIAEGGFGKVYKGEFKGGIFFHHKGRTVGAVKLFDRSKDKADVSFWTEIMLLSKYSHKNLISLLGLCDESDHLILVYEYASNKSLDFHLFGPNLTWTQRLKICIGAATGLQYLHDPRGSQQRVLHRDIKSANILLDENWNAKIADFGLSKYGPANQQHTFLFSDAKGTLGYCDPMYIETMILTKESDVYSFGVVLFEVLCSRPCVDFSYNDQRRSLPILVKQCHQEQSLHTVIDVNLRQQIEQNSLDTFVTLAYQCLEKDRTQRPSMDLVVRKLKTALKHQEGFGAKVQEGNSRGNAIVSRNLSQPEPAKARPIANAESRAKGKAISGPKGNAQEGKGRTNIRASPSQSQTQPLSDLDLKRKLEIDRLEAKIKAESIKTEKAKVKAKASAISYAKAKAKAKAGGYEVESDDSDSSVDSDSD